MTRVKGGNVAKNRRRKVLKAAKGYFGSKHRLFKTAQEQTFHSGVYAFRDRRQNKRNFRKLWIQRINAACRENEISYSKFINGLNKAGVMVNRKMLSELAIDNKEAFADLVCIAKDSLNGKEYNFNSTVTGNITLTAQWVVIVYKVTVYGTDGKTVCATLDVNHGSTVKAPSSCSTSKPGSNFVGYNTNKSATSSSFSFGSTKVTSNLTLYQIHKNKVYKVGCTPNTDASGNATTCTLFITEDGKKINASAIYINNKPSPDSINISRMWDKISEVKFDYGDLKNHTANK